MWCKTRVKIRFREAGMLREKETRDSSGNVRDEKKAKEKNVWRSTYQGLQMLFKNASLSHGNREALVVQGFSVSGLFRIALGFRQHERSFEEKYTRWLRYENFSKFSAASDAEVCAEVSISHRSINIHVFANGSSLKNYGSSFYITIFCWNRNRHNFNSICDS